MKVIGRAVQKESLYPTEYQIHKGIVQYIRKTHPQLARHLIHIPNEGYRTNAGYKAQQLLGQCPGASDLFLAYPKVEPGFAENGFMDYYQFCGLFMELKSKKGKLTNNQIDFIRLMLRSGYKCSVAYSIDEAIEQFEEYIK